MARNAQMLIDLAAAIVSSSVDDGAGVKNQIYASKCPRPMLPMLTSMVNGSISNRDALLAVAEEDGLLSEEAPFSDGTPPTAELQVALYECLLGSRRVRGSSQIVEIVKRRKSSLQQTLAERRRRRATNDYKPKLRMPRYVRVNLLRTTMEAATAHVAHSLGLTLVVAQGAGNNLTITPGTFSLDPVLPGMLVLPPGTSLHGDAEVDRGALVLQDRSSCLTALALNAPPGASVIDTCASPGNKTLHVASMMGGSGSIVAFERSAPRLATLERRIEQQGAAAFVTARRGDFMDTTAEEFAGVTHVLIDPSCSGSGLVSTFQAGADEAAEEETSARVVALADAQLGLILKAMQIPSVTVVAYSTCSIYRTENEDVVQKVLAQSNFECVPAVPGWPHRGLPSDFDSTHLCRASADADSTNGFFVARFERIEKKLPKQTRLAWRKEAKRALRNQTGLSMRVGRLRKAVFGALDLEPTGERKRQFRMMITKWRRVKIDDKQATLVSAPPKKTKKKRA